MIRDDSELKQALEQIGRLYRALAALHQDVRSQGGEQFALLAEGPMEELRRLEHAVHTYTGRIEAEEQMPELWLRVEGPDVVWPETPTSVLTNFLDTLRKGIQVVAEWLTVGDVSTRPTKALKRACDLRIVALQPGSLKVGLRLPDPVGDTPLFPEVTGPDNPAHGALEAYVGVAAWATSDEAAEALAARISNPQLRKLALTQVKRLVPRPRGNVTLV